MAATIGIKIANGDFYSIMEENRAVKKRLVLTTVHNNQKSVQIDLYKSYAKSMADALYIGSLVVENLSPRAKGEPSIELTISATVEGVIGAESFDLGNPSGEHQHLSLHLKSFEEDSGDYSGFDIEEGESGLHEKSPARRERDDAERKIPWLLLAAIALGIVLLGLGLWLFLLRGGGRTGQAPAKSPELTAPRPEPAQSGVPEQPAAAPEPAVSSPAVSPQAANPPPANPPPVTVIDAPPKARTAAPARRREAPVYSYRTPQTIPSEGIVYKIRWGDTLWDISEAFYRNPWLYPSIVRYNRIRNPNLIVSGTEITIPAR